MAVYEIEKCDCCWREITMKTDDVYRRRVRRFSVNWQRPWERREYVWQSICGDCWREIGESVRLMRAEPETAKGDDRDA